ncbi:MAG: hypothetical protein ACO3NW_06050 [Kiritimatiellia bacterium]
MSDLLSSLPPPWLRAARRLRRQINLGWFWQPFSKGLVLSFLVSGILVWLLRVQEMRALPALWMLAGLLVVSAIMAWEHSAERRIGWEEALSRLDVQLGQNQRLVSAWRGVGPWPAPSGISSGLRLKPLKLLGPWMLSALFWGFAYFLPLPPDTDTGSFQRVESLADEWEEQAFFEPERVDTIRRELEQLREKPMQTWYDPMTLEATDHLKSRILNDAGRLQEAMERTSNLLRLAGEERGRLAMPQQQAMQQFLQEMRRQMGEAGLQADSEMLQRLQQIDLTQLQQMDPRALQELEQMLMQNARQMEQSLLQAGILRDFGDQPGAGGVNDGGGPADLTLNDFEPVAEPMVPLGLEAGDLENARMGDLLELRETEHSAEREAVPVRAGELRSAGGEGEVVWEQDHLPAEERILKQFFQ